MIVTATTSLLFPVNITVPALLVWLPIRRVKSNSQNTRLFMLIKNDANRQFAVLEQISRYPDPCISSLLQVQLEYILYNRRCCFQHPQEMSNCEGLRLGEDLGHGLVANPSGLQNRFLLLPTQRHVRRTERYLRPRRTAVVLYVHRLSRQIQSCLGIQRPVNSRSESLVRTTTRIRKLSRNRVNRDKLTET